MRYAALLRGVNVGGKMVKMATLKTAMENNGFSNVKTILNSGNVLFDSDDSDQTALRNRLETLYEKTFGFPIGTIIRSKHQLEKLAAADPFSGVLVTPQTRLYITFLGQAPEKDLKKPYASPDGSFKILSVTDTEIVSVLTVSDTIKTPDAMKHIEQHFGKNVTMRNWNTVMRILKAA